MTRTRVFTLLGIVATSMSCSTLLDAQMSAPVSSQQPKPTSTLDNSSATLNNQIQKPNTQKVTGETSQSQQNPKLKPNKVSKPDATPKLRLISKKQFKEYLKTALTALGVTGTLAMLVSNTAFNYVTGSISKIVGDATTGITTTTGSGSTTGSSKAAVDSPTLLERFIKNREDKRKKQATSNLRNSMQMGSNKATINALVAQKADVHSKDELGNTPLYYAARRGTIDAVQVLLSHGADPNTVISDLFGDTALTRATKEGFVEVVRALIEGKADTNIIQDKYGRSALYFATEKNSLPLVQLLLDNNANPDFFYTILGTTALMHAIQHGHLDIARVLIERNANVNLQYHEDELTFDTALHVAILANNQDAVQLLLNNHADPNISNEDGDTSLMRSCMNDNIQDDIVRLLLTNEACRNSINTRNKYGCTALHWAAHRRTAKLQALIEHNADVNSASNNNCTPLINAAAAGNTEAITLLLQHNANLHVVSNDQRNALMEAAQYNYVNAIALLLNQGIQINAIYNNGPTALICAASRQSLEAVQTLLNHKADPNIARTRDGCTPLHAATSKYVVKKRRQPKHHALTQALLDARANAHAQDNSGKTPLHCAAATGCHDTIQLLIANGAERTIKDNDGHEPAYYATTPELKAILGVPDDQLDNGQEDNLDAVDLG